MLPTPERILIEVKARQEEYRRVCRKGYCTKCLEYVCVDSLGNLLSPAWVYPGITAVPAYEFSISNLAIILTPVVYLHNSTITKTPFFIAFQHTTN